jgi:hypothetical protein
MKIYFTTIILLLILISSCQKDEAIISSYPTGSFTYQSYDTLGNQIVQGIMEIDFVDSVKIKGSWYLENISNRNDIGLQYGEGELIGTIENSTLYLNLNPQYADHNVYLDGTIKEDLIEGRWVWATFIGPTNWGSFKAIKN